MLDPMADRRGAPRFPVILVAEVTELGSLTLLTARTSDISRTGCYIDTLNPMPVGTLARVRLRHGEEFFAANARVAYVCPGLGMGMAFDKNVAAEQLAILDRWLAGAATVRV